MRSANLDRRAFLARLGLLGAVAGSSVLSNVPGAAAADLSESELIDLLRQILAEMTRDTFNAFGVFIAPGPDPYSVAQGAADPAPGAIEARTPEFLITMFDAVVTLPDELTRALCATLADGLTGLPVPDPDDLPDVPPDTVHNLAEAVQTILTGPVLPPLTQIVGLLMNLVATLVNPNTVSGPFLSPYARLSLGEKAAVSSLLEDPASPVYQLLTGQLPEPTGSLVSGLLLNLSGGLLAFGCFGTYSEWSTFDPVTRQLTRRPVGWDISGFQPGVLDGWNDYQGYYQDRREASG